MPTTGGLKLALQAATRWCLVWSTWPVDVIAWSAAAGEWCHPVPRRHRRGPAL